MAGFFREAPGIYRSEALAGFRWLEHGFGTRHGTPHDTPLTVKQIHSDLVLMAGEAAGREGDGVIASRAGEVVGVRTADCVPVLLADPAHRVAAAIHAGWRGSASGIVRRAVEKLEAEFGSEPAALVAAIGPSIGACCYEVGGEVAVQLRPLFPEMGGGPGKQKINLAEANRRQLEACGVPRRAIFACGLCTFCMVQEFFSHRREKGMTGRMMSTVGIRDVAGGYTQERRETEASRLS